MTNLLRSRLVLGTAAFVLIGAITYACSDFLDTPAQGTLNETSLQTKEGVEGSLIAAYRTLDCTSSSGAWGCAASNWVFGDITSDDAYKGSEATDQPGASSITGRWDRPPTTSTRNGVRCTRASSGPTRHCGCCTS